MEEREEKLANRKEKTERSDVHGKKFMIQQHRKVRKERTECGSEKRVLPDTALRTPESECFQGSRSWTYLIFLSNIAMPSSCSDGEAALLAVSWARAELASP